MQGFWQARPEGAPNLNQGIEEHPPSLGNRGGRSVVIDPPNGKIPYQPWALAERDLRRLPESSYDDPELHCFPAGVPRQMYINLHQILQTPTILQILYEFSHAYRTIPLDGRPHIPSRIRLWQGDSVGHWEGDTLVVDTTNNNGKTWLEQTGNFTSDQVHQIERFSMKDTKTIEYEVTISDPKVLTRPFTIMFPLVRVAENDFELLEYGCQEGLVGLQHLRAVQEAAGGRPKRSASSVPNSGETAR
jgi:hypothetical protein